MPLLAEPPPSVAWPLLPARAQTGCYTPEMQTALFLPVSYEEAVAGIYTVQLENVAAKEIPDFMVKFEVCCDPRKNKTLEIYIPHKKKGREGKYRPVCD